MSEGWIRNIALRTRNNGTRLRTGGSAVSLATVTFRLMEHAELLYLIDEFDREYKHVQRPSAVVAKVRSVIQLDDTPRSTELDDHERVHQYLAELHR